MEWKHIIGELMVGNLKGFIFTVDAAFALIVASAAVGILVFANLSTPFGFQPSGSEAYSAAQSLSGTTLSGAAQSSIYASAAANASLGAQSTWPSFANGGAHLSFSNIGPQLPMLLYQFPANAPITSPISVDYGMAVFAAGNILYAVNATTGNLILSKSIQGNVLYPIVYKGYIIYGNSTGYITEVQSNGLVTWNSIALPAAPTSPLSLEDGYVAFGAISNIVLVSPLNGSITYNAVPYASTTPVYGSGLFEISGGTSYGGGGAGSGFALSGGNLQQVWSSTVGDKYNLPAISGNILLVPGYYGLNGYNMAGQLLWLQQPAGTSLPSKAIGGVSISGNTAYWFLYNKIYATNPAAGTLTGNFAVMPTPGNENETPATTARQVYVVANYTHFTSYLLSSNSTPLWNITIPAASASLYQDVALAYGNAYMSGNNILYAFGTCRAPGSDSVLQAIASMYLNGYGGCATALLNSSYKASHIGILINGTYAPSLTVPSFNGKNIAVYAPSIKYPTSSFSVSMWFSANAPGPILDIYNAISNNGVGGSQGFNFGSATLSTTSALSYFNWTMNGKSCTTPANSILAGKWYNINVVVTNYNSVNIYMNGNLDTVCTTSATVQKIANPALAIGVNPTNAPISFGNALITNVQVYTGTLNASQVEGIYLNGIGGVPVPSNSTTSLDAWYPLDGDSNDYSGSGSVGYPYNVTYTKTSFIPASLASAYQVSSTSFPFSLGTKSNALYNVSVVVWR